MDPPIQTILAVQIDAPCRFGLPVDVAMPLPGTPHRSPERRSANAALGFRAFFTVSHVGTPEMQSFSGSSFHGYRRLVSSRQYVMCRGSGATAPGPAI